MSSTRIMQGLSDFSGQQVNMLHVDAMQSRHPEPRYGTTCRKCGAKSTTSQTAIRNKTARCLNSVCGKDAVSKQLAGDRRQPRRDAQALADELANAARQAQEAASAARMDSETADYKLPASRPPVTGSDIPMTERDRLSLRAHREEVAAVERLEREERERPIREAEAKLHETSRELAKVYRARLLAEVKDPEMPGDPALDGVIMSEADASKFNGSEFRKYKDAHPDFYWDHKLLERIGNYCELNGIGLISASILGKIVDRFREYGLLPTRPRPELQPEPEQRPYVNLTIERTSAMPETYEGWDLDSGQRREYSKREVDRMSADQYRRAFRIYRDALELPNVGPGPAKHG